MMVLQQRLPGDGYALPADIFIFPKVVVIAKEGAT
jgi:hypothetical protein